MAARATALGAPASASGGSGSTDANGPEHIPPAITRGIAGLAVGLVVVVACLTLVAVGQPLLANDTWLHLALGEAFAASGPWLDGDPHLFAAPGPPAPAAWLGAWSFYAIWASTGFVGLRMAHVLLVGLVLVLVARAFRRAGASRSGAALGVLAFVTLATYRLVQLRPELFTIAATAGVVVFLLLDEGVAERRRLAAAALLGALWANLHAGFVLGPILLLGTAAALGVERWLPGRAPTGEPSAGDPSRGGDAGVRGLGLAGVAMALGSLLNPRGPGAWLPYLEAGDATLPLEAVVDEWGATNLLAWPSPILPPTPATWLLCWAALAVVVAGTVLFALERSGRRVPGAAGIEPVLLAVGWAGVFAAILATRFLWLAAFAFLLVPAVGRAIVPAPRRAAIGALASLGLVVGVAALHLRVGDWEPVTRALPRSLEGYAEPYPAAKFYGHAMWFLADTGVEGRIFNDYPLGGFMSFWLSPRLSMSSSGTLNVRRDAMEDFLAIAARAPADGPDGASFAERLDRHRFDFFLGTGLPTEPAPGLEVASTLRHVDGVPGWRLVFRNLRSSVHLRVSERNAGNLERIAAWYAEQDVPFDPERGFDVERVIARRPEWAIAHGLAPQDIALLLDQVRRSLAQPIPGPEVRRLSTIYATLGLCERSLPLDARILEALPGDLYARHRRMWCLLQADRLEAARRESARWRTSAAVGGEVDPGGWSALVEELAALDPEARRARVVRQALMPIGQARSLRAGFVLPEARDRRP